MLLSVSMCNNKLKVLHSSSWNRLKFVLFNYGLQSGFQSIAHECPESFGVGFILLGGGEEVRQVILPDNVNALLSVSQVVRDAARYHFSSCKGDSIPSCHGSVSGQEMQMYCFSCTVAAFVFLDIWPFWHVAFPSLEKKGKGRATWLVVYVLWAIFP